MSDPILTLDLTTMRRTVRDALRESAYGQPRPTLTQLQQLPIKLRSHTADLIPVVDVVLRAMDAEDPRHGEITLELKRAQGVDGARPTGDFARDVAHMRHLARLVRSLLDIVEDSQKGQR